MGVLHTTGVPSFRSTIRSTKNDVLYDLRVTLVEVRSSSLLVPTISFKHLRSLTSLREAPNGSIKRAGPGRG